MNKWVDKVQGVAKNKQQHQVFSPTLQNVVSANAAVFENFLILDQVAMHLGVADRSINSLSQVVKESLDQSGFVEWRMGGLKTGYDKINKQAQGKIKDLEHDLQGSTSCEGFVDKAIITLGIDKAHSGELQQVLQSKFQQYQAEQTRDKTRSEYAQECGQSIMSKVASFGVAKQVVACMTEVLALGWVAFGLSMAAVAAAPVMLPVAVLYGSAAALLAVASHDSYQRGVDAVIGNNKEGQVDKERATKLDTMQAGLVAELVKSASLICQNPQALVEQSKVNNTHQR